MASVYSLKHFQSSVGNLLLEISSMFGTQKPVFKISPKLRIPMGRDVKKHCALLRYKTHKYARTPLEWGSLNDTL